MVTFHVIPAKINDREDAERVRALRAAYCFRQLLALARVQVNDPHWFALLGEGEAVMEAWEVGAPHGFFTLYDQRRAGGGGGHRPPSATELQARRMVLLMVVALRRTGFEKNRPACKYAAKALERAGVFEAPPSFRTIERWQSDHPLELTPRDEQLLATAIATSGAGAPHRLTTFFIGLAHLVFNPAPQFRIEP
jgi:hypothetical protein